MSPTDSNIRSSPAKFIAAGFTPVICFSFEQYVGDSANLARFRPNSEEKHFGGVVRGLPSLLFFQQPYERTYSSTAILEYPRAKHPCFLQDLSPDSKAQQLASLTTIRDGRLLINIFLV
ncbi:hypothetical protein TNCV_175411 [Trichonephila clavipes]|nr:hypothetical protein TNCV_175411 [Trichonephila clavipes]